MTLWCQLYNKECNQAWCKEHKRCGAGSVRGPLVIGEDDDRIAKAKMLNHQQQIKMAQGCIKYHKDKIKRLKK